MTTKQDLRNQFLSADPSAAKAALNSKDGGVITFSKEVTTLTGRIMPPYKTRNGKPVHFSMADMHYKVPVPNLPEGRENVTHSCPRSVGNRCLTCEHEDHFISMGVWGENGQMGCKPTTKVRFNFLSADNPGLGVQIFQDGRATLSALNSLIENEPTVLDPFDGGFVRIVKLSKPPWRTVDVPKDGWRSLDEVEGVDIEWALPQNLQDLDDSWNYPSLETQMEWYESAAPASSSSTSSAGTRATDEDLDDIFDSVVQQEEGK